MNNFFLTPRSYKPESKANSFFRPYEVDADATYVESYERPLAKYKPRGEIRQLAPNEAPLSWQYDDAVDNYNAIHDKTKELWDDYVIDPETVNESNQYWEQLGIDNPSLIPIAALGSTLSGEAYDMYRDVQTDPANLVGGEGLKVLGKAGNAGRELLGIGGVKLIKDLQKEMPLFHASTAKFKPTFNNLKGEFSDEFLGSTKGYGQMAEGSGHYFTDNLPAANYHAEMLKLQRNIGADKNLHVYKANFKPEVGGLKVLNSQSKASEIFKADPALHSTLRDRFGGEFGQASNFSAIRRDTERQIAMNIRKANPGMSEAESRALAQDIFKKDLISKEYGALEVPLLDASNWVVYDPKSVDIIDRYDIPATW